MRWLSCSIVCAVCCMQSYAQAIRVNILSERVPLEYANLFINNKYYGYSDSTGVVEIAREAVSAGDSIVVTFVGMDNGFAVYDPGSYPPQGITMSLIPNLNIGGAVIRGENMSRKLLERYVRERYAARGFYQHGGNYSVRPMYREDNSGWFLLTDYEEGYVDYLGFEIVALSPEYGTEASSVSKVLSAAAAPHMAPNSDTAASMSPADIKNIIYTAWEAAIDGVKIKDIYLSAVKMRVNYMGEENGSHIFTLVRPLRGDKNGFSTVIYANSKNGKNMKRREITFAKTTLLYPDGTYVDFSAEYALSPIGSDSEVVYPTKIDGSLFYENRKYYFSLENIEVISRLNISAIPYVIGL